MKLRHALPIALLAAAGCDALTAHVDVVARAGPRELTATKLAEMMTAANLPPRKDIAIAVTNLWVNYQLLGYAAAHGDTLNDPKLIDEAMWAQIAQRKSQRFYDMLTASFKAPDAAGGEKAFNSGELVAVRHILISANRNLLKPNQIDSARRVADNVRRQATPANFVTLVKKYSGDPGAKQNDGEYVFPPGKGAMVSEFEQGSMALKPGEISQPVQSQFGFHIILRESYPEAKAKVDPMYAQIARQAAESTYLDKLEKGSNVEVKSGAAKVVKEMAEDLDRFRDDRTVLVTSRSVDLRAGRVAMWIAAMPPQMQARRQIQQAPDSVIPGFLKSLMRNELILRAADSAKITIDSTEMASIRGSFRGSLASSLAGLNLVPARLADSASTPAEREQLAARRVDEFIARLLKNEAQFVDVSEPVTVALRRHFESRVVVAGIDRAVAQVTTAKAKADSAKNAAMPKSVVPMPGQSAKSDSVKKP